MKATSLLSFSVILGFLTLAACNQHPLQRESNPLKGYDHLGNEPLEGSVKKLENYNYDDPKVCPKDFTTVTITNSEGKSVSQLSFKAGEKKTFKINVKSTASQFKSLALELYQPPTGMSLSPVNDKQLCDLKMKAVDEKTAEGSCELSYTPSDIQNDVETPTVLYYIRSGKQGCDAGYEPKQLALSVTSKGRAAPSRGKTPSLALTKKIDINKVYAKSEKIEFTAKVTDPNRADSEQFIAPQFEPKDAGSCESTGDKSPNFNCKIELSKLVSSAKGGMTQVSFNVFAKSVSTEESARRKFDLTVSLEEKVGANP